MTDVELWRGAAAGDPQAFGLLFERHAHAVYVYCFRRTADWSLAEDLTSIVFLEAWRRRADVRLERDSALPWLLGVATNSVRNASRSLRRYRTALERLPLEREQDLGDEVAERIDDEHRMRSLLSALACLPKREQDVIALCRFAGLSYEAAAVALDVPVGTIRSRLARGRVRLEELERTSGHNSNDIPTALADEAT